METFPEEVLVNRLLEVIENDVVPMTFKTVAQGNKVFGAAILKKSDLSLVVAGTNEEIDSPLWHGEVACIRNFWALPAEGRPQPSECFMLATHEPCPMCISAITWSAFSEVYHLFSMESTRDAFNIPHDLKIFKEVFGCERATRKNSFFSAYDIPEIVEELAEPEAARQRVIALKEKYNILSQLYQDSKNGTDMRIPLA